MTASQHLGRTGSTTSQLRDDIDSGRTGDKIAWPDPAAAPLGTDEEAAGTPLHPTAILAARRSERAPHSPATRDAHRHGGAWFFIGLIVCLVIAAVIWIVV
jgi:hypothetical protein